VPKLNWVSPLPVLAKFQRVIKTPVSAKDGKLAKVIIPENMTRNITFSNGRLMTHSGHLAFCVPLIIMSILLIIIILNLNLL
jgi:hypothetical protein